MSTYLDVYFCRAPGLTGRQSASPLHADMAARCASVYLYLYIYIGLTPLIECTYIYMYIYLFLQGTWAYWAPECFTPSRGNGREVRRLIKHNYIYMCMHLYLYMSLSISKYASVYIWAYWAPECFTPSRGTAERCLRDI